MRDRIDFRLLDTHDIFYKYVKEQNTTPSEALRHLVRESGNTSALSITEKKELHRNLVELKKELRPLGVNLNQISRYFNQQSFLLESDLHKQHLALIEQQKLITTTLNEALRILCKN